MPKQKARNRSSAFAPRSVDTREPRQRFLIVCEGERTEPNYFRAFRVPGLVIEIKGIAKQARQLVEEAIRYRNQQPYDQVWCVFDRDDVLAAEFNDAIRFAKQEDMDVAYSNEAFELWYLLHFHYYATALQRQQYADLLDKLLKHRYVKNSTTMYAGLLILQPQALKHAHKLLAEHPSSSTPASCNPSTTVHLLVEELNKHRRDD